uniref:F-box domain-containing protein n=1 Tax=Nelumbo nucifera TaxID=4432 RepID=A0A822YNG2_NELNU|nr:TPA_asm: hypothetical protein HUJ06_009679 [Nelumbo nucifera]
MKQRAWAFLADGEQITALSLGNNNNNDRKSRRSNEKYKPQERRHLEVCGSRCNFTVTSAPRRTESTRRSRFDTNASSSQIAHHDFSLLPFDVLAKVAASFTLSNLQSASLVCRSWRDALRPLREAMLFLRWGKRFKHGHGGVRPNLDKALDSFLKGAARGSTLAMVDAGLIYWEIGKKGEGIALYKKAAELGDPAGQCNLGISYLQAEPSNPKEAMKWLYQASVAGHVRAQYQLALCLHQGRGVESNLAEAAKWYLRAAEGGYVRAMYNTSLCYSFGEGLVHNHQQARKWMKRAADRGHSKAQFEHGLSLFSVCNANTTFPFLERNLTRFH